MADRRDRISPLVRAEVEVHRDRDREGNLTKEDRRADRVWRRLKGDGDRGDAGGLAALRRRTRNCDACGMLKRAALDGLPLLRSRAPVRTGAFFGNRATVAGEVDG